MELPDWLRAYAIVGETPDGHAVVRLTEDGELYAYLVGDHEGTVVPVTLDSEGRLSAFVVDSSDVWERIVKVGNAELAARLGGMPKYHRTGQVHFLEDFEQGIGRWDTTLSGTGAEVALSPVTSSTGGYCVKLTGGSDVFGSALIKTRRGILPIGKVGLSFAFSIPSNIEGIHTIFSYHDGVDVHNTGIGFDDVNDDLEYFDSADTWQRVDDVVATQRYAYAFNYAKMIVDFAADEYVTFFFNNREFDLSGIPMSVSPLADPPGFYIEVTLHSRAGNNDVAYVDDIILTAAEL